MRQAADADGDFRKRFFSDAQFDDEAHAQVLLAANFRAEYLLVWELVIGRQAADIASQFANLPAGIADQAVDACWTGAAEQILDLHALSLSITTGMSEAQAATLVANTINARDYANQMRFWMTPAHAPYVLEGRELPGGLYTGLKSAPKLGEQRSGTVDPLPGLAADPSRGPDLGAVNGCNPVQEGEKARYMTAMLAAVHDG